MLERQRQLSVVSFRCMTMSYAIENFTELSHLLVVERSFREIAHPD